VFLFYLFFMLFFSPSVRGVNKLCVCLLSLCKLMYSLWRRIENIMAVSPAVRRYLAQLEKVSNPKAPCKRKPSKYIGKEANIRGKGNVRGLACSDQKGKIWGAVEGVEQDIPLSLLAGKAHRSDGRAVKSFLRQIGGRKALGVEYAKVGEGRKTKWRGKLPSVKRYAGYGRKGTGMGPANFTQFMTAKSDLPRGQKGKSRKLAFRMSEKQLRASRKGTKGAPLRRADLLKLNAARFEGLSGKTLTDRRRKLASRDAAGFMALYESRARAVVAKAERKAKKPASEVKGAPEVSDSAVERAVAQLPAAEVKQVEVLADQLVDAGMPESEVEKLGRLLLVEINKIPSKEVRLATALQLSNTLRAVAERPKLGRPTGSKNKAMSAKVAKATGEAMASEVKEVAKGNGAQSLASASNPRRRAMPARHLIRF
jgi:hypothetical protein